MDGVLSCAASRGPPLPQVIPGSEGVYRYNFWGYSTVGYFAPMARFSAAAAQGGKWHLPLGGEAPASARLQL